MERVGPGLRGHVGSWPCVGPHDFWVGFFDHPIDARLPGSSWVQDLVSVGACMSSGVAAEGRLGCDPGPVFPEEVQLLSTPPSQWNPREGGAFKNANVLEPTSEILSPMVRAGLDIGLLIPCRF